MLQPFPYNWSPNIPARAAPNGPQYKDCRNYADIGRPINPKNATLGAHFHPIPCAAEQKASQMAGRLAFSAVQRFETLFLNMLHRAEDAVRAYINDAIDRGEFRAHAQLPPERILADTIGVSRAAVRQALTVLEAEEKIYRHVGRGTFVAERASGASASLRRPIDTSPSKIIEARSVLEVRLAELVVLNATERDLRTIRAASEELKGVSDALEFERADGNFHRTIAQACHNELLIDAYDLIAHARSDPEWIKLKVLKNQHADARKNAVRDEHEAIVVALEARDRAGAAAAMQSHLLNVRNNLLGF